MDNKNNTKDPLSKEGKNYLEHEMFDTDVDNLSPEETDTMLRMIVQFLGDTAEENGYGYSLAIWPEDSSFQAYNRVSDNNLNNTVKIILEELIELLTNKSLSKNEVEDYCKQLNDTATLIKYMKEKNLSADDIDQLVQTMVDNMHGSMS